MRLLFRSLWVMAFAIAAMCAALAVMVAMLAFRSGFCLLALLAAVTFGALAVAIALMAVLLRRDEDWVTRSFRE